MLKTPSPDVEQSLVGRIPLHPESHQAAMSQLSGRLIGALEVLLKHHERVAQLWREKGVVTSGEKEKKNNLHRALETSRRNKRRDKVILHQNIEADKKG